MPNQNYTLEVISQHPQFLNKSFRKYYVNGIETVGAYGDEPFEIRFKNNTWQKVQVKLSLDGSDILTGKPATTEVSNDMWVVEPQATLNLKAWPETVHGGSAFVFTSANNSVAVHTHGDLSCRGIIAAAVYVEDYVAPPVRVVECHHHNVYPWYVASPIWLGGNDYAIFNGKTEITYSSSINNVYTNNSFVTITNSGSISCNTLPTTDINYNKSLESLVSIGAGDHVDQKITYVAGLVKPTFTETIRIKYMWYDDLVSCLKETQCAEPHASGFPGDKNQQVMSIGSTPKVGSKRTSQRKMAEPVYSRI